MIKEFVERFEDKKKELEAVFRAKHPDEYLDVVRAVTKVLKTDDFRSIDPGRIHQIGGGDYQGTLVFVIAAEGYQPDEYWYVPVGYGSCGGCDTLQGVRESGSWDEPPNDEQVKDYMTLALHIVQGLKKMGDENEN
tara:strand:+ start:341 stop:748 length:408 start_codon:yes stop_codon:yes gene_type:complete